MTTFEVEVHIDATISVEATSEAHATQRVDDEISCMVNYNQTIDKSKGYIEVTDSNVVVDDIATEDDPDADHDRMKEEGY